jgi:hypothetical protein
MTVHGIKFDADRPAYEVVLCEDVLHYIREPITDYLLRHRNSYVLDVGMFLCKQEVDSMLDN